MVPTGDFSAKQRCSASRFAHRRNPENDIATREGGDEEIPSPDADDGHLSNLTPSLPTVITFLPSFSETTPVTEPFLASLQMAL